MVSLVSLNKPIVNNPVRCDGSVGSSYFVSAVSHSVQDGDQIMVVVLDILFTR